MNPVEGTLVIHCSDPRFQGAFHDFLTKDLRLDRYALIAVPGGPQFLTMGEHLPKFAWAGWRWLKFLGDIGHEHRFILIAHEDCLWYRHVHFAVDEKRQFDDLRAVCAQLGERFPGARIELYFARLSNGKPRIERV